MLHYLFGKIASVFLIFISFTSLWAQFTMGIRDESSAVNQPNMVDLVLLLKNENTVPFTGKVIVEVPKGFRAVSGKILKIDLAAGEQKFLPIKILVSNDAVSGDSELSFKGVDEHGNLVAQKKMTYHVAENNALRLSAENPLLYINENTINDSVEVKARVTNTGNRRQNVTVVFKIPETSQGAVFVEKKGSLGVKKDTVFSFKFVPAHVLKNTQLTVNMTGFREPEKEIFGNTSVVLQNVSSVHRYVDTQSFTGFSSFSKNNLTAGYRRVGDDAEMFQLMGSGGVNLPSGYVFVRGNVYTMNNQDGPMVNNTYISYHRENSEITLGNINKVLEIPMFGRGAEYVFTSSDKDKKAEIGFVDQSFNLIDRTQFLKNGYGFYGKGTLGAQNTTRSVSGVYVFRNDPYEKANHNLMGTDVQYLFSKNWRLNAKLYSGMSFYDKNSAVKPSFGAESQYSGVIGGVNLNGNYFYSTAYYPGNRRGTLQIQQSFSKTVFKEHYAYANILVSDFSPRYVSFNYDLKSQNLRFDTGINFAKKGNFGWGLGYQYQEETSNSFNSFFTSVDSRELYLLKAQRFTEYASWMSSDRNHSSVLNLETGWVNYPNASDPKLQMKLTGTYTFKSFNLSTVYQSGAYYLAEYAFSKMMNKNEEYRKLSLSFSYNNSFFKDRINLASGFSYTDDVLYGKAPSAFFNVKYSGKKYGLYLNSSWYNFVVGNVRNNTATVEVGVSLNLPTATLDPGKKGNIKAFVFYDYNNNNVFDDGDVVAEGYRVMINTISFKSDKEGNIEYQKIPFGEYHLKQVIQKGWYYDEKNVEVNNYHCALEIPLHQNGTVSGKITYDFDEKKAQEFTPKLAGMVLNVFQGEKLVQRISTDDMGEYLVFLETGSYRFSLNEASLPANTYSEQGSADVQVMAGKITWVNPLVIKVKEKKIRVKKFGS